MELIPAPGRQLKTYSTWLGIIITVAGAAVAAVGELKDILTKEQIGIAVSMLGALLTFAKLVKQDIPVTAEEKIDMIKSAASATLKSDQQDPKVTVTVANPPESSK